MISRLQHHFSKIVSKETPKNHNQKQEGNRLNSRKKNNKIVFHFIVSENKQQKYLFLSAVGLTVKRKSFSIFCISLNEKKKT